MVSGGHGRSGRVAEPGSLRSAARQGEWLDLPPEGCSDPTPKWPLAEQSEREAELWERMWAMPQAAQWHQMHLFDEIGFYCRYFAESEDSKGNRESRTLLRQHRELLGLSTAGLERLKWRIGAAEPVEEHVAEHRPPVRSSVRDRLRAVQGGA
jgi:hypothetical protein